MSAPMFSRRNDRPMLYSDTLTWSAWLRDRRCPAQRRNVEAFAHTQVALSRIFNILNFFTKVCTRLNIARQRKYLGYSQALTSNTNPELCSGLGSTNLPWVCFNTQWRGSPSPCASSLRLSPFEREIIFIGTQTRVAPTIGTNRQ